ncbi:MAG: TIGR03013 family PEP-CTERM/XrtA system glycosyltransferase [Polyangiaceae bacterium]|nr:TIGR03013 family PEP-CTERM/XrtA system glycosyltransferase [Polyangiaceae bacterium]
MLEVFRSPRRALVWFVEASLLALLVSCAAGLLLGWEHALAGERVARALGISLVAQASLYYHGLYGKEPLGARALFLTMLRALALAAVALAAGSWLVPGAELGARVFLVSLGAAALVLPAWRAAFARVASSESFRRPALILGSGELADACADLIRRDNDAGLRLTGRLVRDDAPGGGPDVIGRFRDLARIVEERGVAAVIVACPDRRRGFPVDELLELKLRGVQIEEGTDLYERVTGKIFVRALLPSQIIFSQGFHVRRRTLAVKRAFDVVCAAIGLIVALPIMIVTAIAVKLDSPGPFLYSQVRTGAHGRLFRIHKFRSMRADAEKDGAAWAAENDPRVTRVGRVIRATRLDELPQLWNVLAGEMSLVGPRPERPEFVAMLERQIPFFRQRLSVKPGVTGHAQVRCRYGASAEDALEKLQYDLFYMKRFSLWFDLSILVDTVKVVLLRIGSR